MKSLWLRREDLCSELFILMNNLAAWNQTQQLKRT
jgi:hypothetical protein